MSTSLLQWSAVRTNSVSGLGLGRFRGDFERDGELDLIYIQDRNV